MTVAIFNIGDHVAYPVYGVGVIQKITEKEVGGKTHKFYTIRLKNNKMNIMVSQDRATSIGMRSLASAKDINDIFETLKKKDPSVDQSNWNSRSRRYMEKIQTGSLVEVAEVLRNLFLLKNLKTLSFSEREVLNITKKLLIQEISIANGSSTADVEYDLTEVLFSSSTQE